MKKYLCMLLICVLLIATAQATSIDESLFEAVPEATPCPTVAVEAAPASKIRDDGMLRVSLRSLGAPDRLTLTLDGEYTVEHDAGFRFERGAQVVLTEDAGMIYMSVSGLTMAMGTSLTLTRQATGQAANGMYIEEAKCPGNLYSGDLHVRLGEGGGMEAILTIGIEDYLSGVIGYEMSDSWPLEALKAQAVAARTYALSRKLASAERDYDVVDTTGDQVFRGTDAAFANVRAAVEATRGIVLTLKGKPVTAYFTASNGGEIALPGDMLAGTDDCAYIKRKEDPYDVANPLSIVNTVAFAADMSDNEAVRTMVADALDEYARENNRADERLAAISIASIEPVDPVPADSKMYTRLKLMLNVSGITEGYGAAADDIRAPAPATDDPAADAALRGIDYLRRYARESPYTKDGGRAPLDEQIPVYLGVYDDIKQGLGLGINSTDCELVSIISANGAFGIEMRRYGHGIGMSQRGAQRMAGVEDFRFDEILNFYYDGAAIERVEWDMPELEPLAALSENVGFDRPKPTPTPTPAPLRALKDGEYYAVVRLGDAASALNVREKPGTQNPVVTTLVEGREVIVMSDPDANGWVEISTAEYHGFCKLEYLKAK